jgi:hypothetical protein
MANAELTSTTYELLSISYPGGSTAYSYLAWGNRSDCEADGDLADF